SVIHSVIPVQSPQSELFVSPRMAAPSRGFIVASYGPPSALCLRVIEPSRRHTCSPYLELRCLRISSSRFFRYSRYSCCSLASVGELYLSLDLYFTSANFLFVHLS